MKKMSILGATLALLLAPLAFTATVNAASTCPIGFTGPNSQNLCESEAHYTCEVENNTAVIIDNSNNQVATTGDATNGSSGSATNSNGTTFTTTISNEGTCTVAATTSVVTPPATPTVSTPPAPVAPPVAASVQPRTLPNTATLSPTMTLASLAGLLGLAIVGSRLVVATYGRFKA